MPKTQLNAFKSMFLIRISNNLLISKVDQINQISILSFYFSTFFRKAFPHDLFCPFSSAIYFRITYLLHAASAGDFPLKCRTFHYGLKYSGSEHRSSILIGSQKNHVMSNGKSIITCNTSYVFKKSGYKYEKRIFYVFFLCYIYSIPKKHVLKLKLIRRNE